MAKTVKSYITETNDFLTKLKGLVQLPDFLYRCLVGLYPNIPHGLSTLRTPIDLRTEKKFQLVGLAETIVRNNILNFNLKTYRQKRDTTIDTKFIPPYFTFKSSLKLSLKQIEFKPYVWWGYIDFFVWRHRGETLNVFNNSLNKILLYHQFLDATAVIEVGVLKRLFFC